MASSALFSASIVRDWTLGAFAARLEATLSTDDTAGRAVLTCGTRQCQECTSTLQPSPAARRGRQLRWVARPDSESHLARQQRQIEECGALSDEEQHCRPRPDVQTDVDAQARDDEQACGEAESPESHKPGVRRVSTSSDTPEAAAAHQTCERATASEGTRNGRAITQKPRITCHEMSIRLRGVGCACPSSLGNCKR